MFRVLSAPDETTALATPAPVGGSTPLIGATETTLPGLAAFKGLVLAWSCTHGWHARLHS